VQKRPFVGLITACILEKSRTIFYSPKQREKRQDKAIYTVNKKASSVGMLEAFVHFCSA